MCYNSIRVKKGCLWTLVAYKYSSPSRPFGGAHSISTQSHALWEYGLTPALLVGLRCLTDHWLAWESKPTLRVSRLYPAHTDWSGQAWNLVQDNETRREVF